MNDGDPRVDRSIRAWFDEGPTRAPDTLLATVLGRTRGHAQRPGWLARMAGTPTAALAIDRRPLGRATWAAILLALVAVATAVVVAGSLVLGPHRVVSLPSPTIAASPTPAATQAPRATPDAAPAIATVELPLVLREDLGFEVAYDTVDLRAGPADGLGTTGLPGVTFGLPGLCRFDPCAQPVGITSAPVGDGAPVVLADRVVRVSGRSLDEIVASFAAKVGAIDVRDDTVTIDGENGVRLYAGPFEGTFVLHRDRIYVIELLGPRRAEILARTPGVFFERLHFVTAATPISAEASWLQVGLAARIAPEWTVSFDGPGRTQIDLAGGFGDSHSWIQAFGSPTSKDDLPTALRAAEANFLAIEPTVERWFTIAPLGEVGNGDLFVRPDADPVAFFIRGTTVFTVTAHVDPADVARWGNSEDVLRTFLASVDLATDFPWRATWRDLHLDLGPAWKITVDGQAALQASYTVSTFLGPSVTSFRISAIKTGTHADVSTAGAALPRIGGSTLREAADSIDAALAPGNPAPDDLSVNGEPGFEWSLPVDDTGLLAGGATAIVIFEHRGVFYVVTASSGMGGSGGAPQALLDSMTFIR